MYGKGYFGTVSGGACYLTRPEDSDIRLLDISLALSRIQRFGGHCRRGCYYSVAQHSILVSLIVDHHLGHPEHALAGLLHDAPEAYLGDMISPLKSLVPAYQIIERSWALTIAEIFDLEDLDPEPVRVADRIALELERQQLLTPGPGWESWRGSSRPLPPWQIHPMSERGAETMFLRRFWEVTQC